MKRSTTQVLYRHLPGSVFMHEDGFIAKTFRVTGQQARDLNTKLLLEEVATALERWRPDQVGIPNPRTAATEFVVYEPEEVTWDVYPLTFACTSHRCGRVTRWFTSEKLLNDHDTNPRLKCKICSAPLRQLRYLTAHECGQLDPLYTPPCKGCSSRDDVYLDDTGSFRSSSWRCRSCGWSQSTRFVPCKCGRYAQPGGQAFQQGFTARDQRLWYPQSVTLLNISGQTYDNLQGHPQRGIAALASWLGDQTDVAASLTELDRGDGGTRMTAAAWAAEETKLRAANVDADIIASVRALKGPVTTGPAAIAAEMSQQAIEAATTLAMVERAGLYDKKIITDRTEFASVLANATGPDLRAAQHTNRVMTTLGIEDVSVTQSFPVLLASYGYTRCAREPGKADLCTYAQPRQYKGKTPIFALPAATEALLVTFDARQVLSFLKDRGTYNGPTPNVPREARIAAAEMLAADSDVGGDGPGGVARRLIHSASHALLRALDDGQSGFGESSLAEWIVTDAFTTAIYVASYNDFTLGAFDTVLRRRVSHWLQNAKDSADLCDNDPMCSHVSSAKPHAACDRCLHLTFGCRMWNADLDRHLLRDFWQWTAAAPPPP